MSANETAEVVLSVDNIVTQFNTAEGTVHAVNGVSFDVHAGELLGVVGESGCGKSVTMMSLVKLVPMPPAKIVKGSAMLDGKDLIQMDLDELQKVRGAHIGFIFQDPMTSLNPVLTVGYQLTEALRLHKRMSKKAARAKAVEILELVGIPLAEKRLNDYPHQFSGGMRQRVMIAMALACDPKLIIADEPTTALDVTIQAQILELMKGLSERLGVAQLIITHNLGVVARYAKRVNVMYAGKIVEMGLAKDIYHNPSHPYTLGLLASVPRLDQARGTKLIPIEGQPPDLARLDKGCAFRPRCRFATERCAQEIPELMTVSDEHRSACWNIDTLVREKGSAA